MSASGLAVIILAAGKGTRMRSGLPKVLHHLADLPMVDHVLRTSAAVDPAEICLVVGPEFEPEFTAGRKALFDNLSCVTQVDRLGTGHAVRVGVGGLAGSPGRIAVLYGDTPLVSTATLEKLASSSAAVSAVVFEAEDPAAYGRIVTDDRERPVAIVEFKDADEAQKEITLCNGGLMAFDAEFLARELPNLSDDNAQGEYYLTDLLKIAADKGLETEAILVAGAELAGVNSKLDLASVGKTYQTMRRRQAMIDGVTLVDPETVHFSHDTEIAADVIIEQNVVFGPGVRVETGARIRAFSHLEGAVVGPEAFVGPYARLRPGTELGARVKIGNFVEVKKAVFAEGAKANHLSYIGDATIGEAANIGAGTITCNYDGYNKWLTEIGAGAFIGSNSALVAPVKVADGAIVAAGTTLTKDVDADALALTRAEQRNVTGAGEKFRAQRQKIKQRNAASKG